VSLRSSIPNQFQEYPQYRKWDPASDGRMWRNGTRILGCPLGRATKSDPGAKMKSQEFAGGNMSMLLGDLLLVFCLAAWVTEMVVAIASLLN
jgi:hypothetical protein